MHIYEEHFQANGSIYSFIPLSTAFPFLIQSHILQNLSAIHAPEAEWAGLLRQRALDAPVSHDLEGLLNRYRQNSHFYADRIGAADA